MKKSDSKLCHAILLKRQLSSLSLSTLTNPVLLDAGCVGNNFPHNPVLIKSSKFHQCCPNPDRETYNILFTTESAKLKVKYYLSFLLYDILHMSVCLISKNTNTYWINKSHVYDFDVILFCLVGNGTIINRLKFMKWWCEEATFLFIYNNEKMSYITYTNQLAAARSMEALWKPRIMDVYMWWISVLTIYAPGN